MSTPTDHAELPPLDADYSISDAQVERFWRDGFIVLRAVLSPGEIRAYGRVIRETARRRFAAKQMQPAAHGAFLQTLGLRFDSEGVRRFCLAPRFGAIAARMLQVPAVRIYHEQALFKQPGGGDSHWHQDQYYWPLATDRSLGLWMPLVDCSREMGSIRFVRGSHRYGDLEGQQISDESAQHFDQFIAPRAARDPSDRGTGGGRLHLSPGLDRAWRAGQSLGCDARGDDRHLLPRRHAGRHPRQPGASRQRTPVSRRTRAGGTGRRRSEHGGVSRASGRVTLVALSQDSVHGFPVLVRPLKALSDDQFYEFCRLNDELQIERTAHGDLLLMAPASFRTSHLNLRIAMQLGQWADRDGTGLATESSGGFILRDSAVVAPDAAWILSDRLNAVPRERQERFLPLCPDFVIELLSPTDTLARTQAKMREYLANGLRLGWLIDPFARQVYVYRRDAEPQVLDDPDAVAGDPVLPGFRLDLSKIW